MQALKEVETAKILQHANHTFTGSKEKADGGLDSSGQFHENGSAINIALDNACSGRHDNGEPHVNNGLSQSFDFKDEPPEWSFPSRHGNCCNSHGFEISRGCHIFRKILADVDRGPISEGRGTQSEIQRRCLLPE